MPNVVEPYAANRRRNSPGRMTSHNDKGGKKCEGSGHATFEGRGTRHVTGQGAMGVVSGGLPGQGKHR